jgi:molybdopterin converting factor subunit 1
MRAPAPVPGQVVVRLFAAFREAAGTSTVAIAASDAASVGALWAHLVVRFPALAAGPPPSAAVNARFAKADTRLAPGDEVAFLPPVSGG